MKLSLAIQSTLILFLASGLSLHAQKTWSTSTTDTLWDNGDNWSPTGAPTNNNSLIFGATTTNGSLTNNLADGLTFNTITFGADAPAYTFNGNGIVLASGFVNNSSATQTINFAINHGGVPKTYNTAAGDIVLGETPTGATVIKTGAHTLVMPTFRTGSTITEGTLSVNTMENSGGAMNLGSTTSTNRATLQYTGSATFTFTRNFFINLNGALDASGTAALTINTGTLNVSQGSGSPRTLTLTGTSALANTFSSVLNDQNASAVSSLRKEGSGRWVITSVNGFTGTTEIVDGILAINGSGSINGSSDVIINGGTLAYNSSTNLSAPLSFSIGTLAGTNWAGSLNNLTIGAGQTIAPGNSPGTANTTTQTWAGDGTYLWEINDASGTAGTDPGWDLINLSGELVITATNGNRFTIQITSLTTANDPGDAANFDGDMDYAFLIAQSGQTIALSDTDVFAIDDSAFSNSTLGSWSILRGDAVAGGNDSQLWLTYAAIPEPSTYAFFAGMLAAMVVFYRRRLARG
jgi:autotransporter-associated beta strand protein